MSDIGYDYYDNLNILMGENLDLEYLNRVFTENIEYLNRVFTENIEYLNRVFTENLEYDGQYRTLLQRTITFLNSAGNGRLIHNISLPRISNLLNSVNITNRIIHFTVWFIALLFEAYIEYGYTYLSYYVSNISEILSLLTQNQLSLIVIILSLSVVRTDEGFVTFFREMLDSNVRDYVDSDINYHATLLANLIPNSVTNITSHFGMNTNRTIHNFLTNTIVSKLIGLLTEYFQSGGNLTVEEPTNGPRITHFNHLFRAQETQSECQNECKIRQKVNNYSRNYCESECTATIKTPLGDIGKSWCILNENTPQHGIDGYTIFGKPWAYCDKNAKRNSVCLKKSNKKWVNCKIQEII